MLAVAVAALGLTPGAASATNPLEQRARERVAEFADWLAAGRAQGLLGEVGWPADDPRWAGVARSAYDEAARRGLWAAAWSAGELWQASYRLLVYGSSRRYGPVDTAFPQAAVVEGRREPRLRGVNVEQGAFGFDVDRPLGDVYAYGVTYAYPGAATYRFLAGRGIAFVRLPFRWERLQPTPMGSLDGDDASRLAASVRAAGAAGLRVVLDAHNYGGFLAGDRRLALGSPSLPAAALADLWRRLAVLLRDEPAVLGYALMNEPTAMPGGAAAWERASQAAVTAIRRTGDARRVFVASYDWGGTWQFARYHPRGPWIRDPRRNTWYEAHLYFDGDRSGRYAASFDAELARARGDGF